MNILNFILDTDSYKVSHYLQYPRGTTNVFSYIESRGGVYPETVFFGLQIYLKEYLQTPITMEDVDEAAAVLAVHGEPFNREGWEYIVKEHGGLVPVSIKAVAEGLVVPTHNVLVTVESTDPKCAWVVSYLETSILRAVWYGTTVASQSRSIKKVIARYLELSGDPSTIDFKLHDFGARGVSSRESAGIGGAAHLVNFKGTDTLAGIMYAMKYYDTPVPGFSIPAAEHSTITTYGREGEVEAYRRMIQAFSKPGSVYAVVSDSYDIYNAVENLWGGVLRQEVIDAGGLLVIRPDSGDPVKVTLKCVKLLDRKFGSTVNAKGYKVLNYVRLIQGDGINEATVDAILKAFTDAGYSADNIAFGMGGALLQQVNRDTNKFAMKCSAMEIGGVWHDVYKDPVTDPGKRSKRGRLKLAYTPGIGYQTLNLDEYVKSPYTTYPLVEVYRNGVITKTYTFEEVRTLAAEGVF